MCRNIHTIASFCHWVALISGQGQMFPFRGFKVFVILQCQNISEEHITLLSRRPFIEKCTLLVMAAHVTSITVTPLLLPYFKHHLS